MRKLKDNSEMEATSHGVLHAKPMPKMAIESSKNPPVNGMRLSYRETSHPENGRPIIELIGMNSRIVPSSASL